jgi:proteasome lid subunit RPN8/RPN11
MWPQCCQQRPGSYSAAGVAAAAPDRSPVVPPARDRIPRVNYALLPGCRDARDRRPAGGPDAAAQSAVTLAVVLNLDATILEQIVAHARRDHPDEACGVVAGPAGSDEPTRHIPMLNAARSMTFYEFDSREYLKVWRELDDRDEEAVVIYHSHTATEAFPSRTDVSFAGWPQAHYLLVSTRDPEITEVRSFRIVDGNVTEEPVSLVNATIDNMAVQSYMFGQSPAAVDYECRA